MNYKLPYNKTSTPCTYKQVQYLESFKNVKWRNRPSTSQIMKRMSKADISELIEAAKEGEEITLSE